ncbi:MAG TPA: hypothetical protein VFW19_02875 [Allosphingosinicella sp.]|nr:hypothetical protein [Allosphingosinicella sp.]
MKRLHLLLACALLAGLGSFVPPVAAPAAAQASGGAQREATRERLRTFLATAGARNDVNIAFQQSQQNPWNFTGVARGGFANSDYLEIVIGISANNTLSVIVYPHYRGGYINLGRARDPAGLMRKLLNLNDHNFFHWGADDTDDVFTAYNFTLESGFPDQSLLVALTSIRAQDQFIAALRPVIEGTGGK